MATTSFVRWAKWDCKSDVGWHACFIVVSEREAGYLGTSPAHRPEQARELVTLLGANRHWQSGGQTTLDSGMYPNRDHAVVGAYDGAAILADQSFFEGVPNQLPQIDALHARYTSGDLLVALLSSTVNLWYYALYQRGTLVRAYGGDADAGVRYDSGSLLPEEQPVFNDSVLRDGQRIFVLDGEEYAAHQVGETLLFAVCARFFGQPLDQFDSDDLAMEKFIPQGKLRSHRFARLRQILHLRS